jgi:CRISPR-associated protein Cmr2
MSYLVSIAIGPVQDFIAAARRSRDLWFGSYLLSEASKAVAASAAGHGELIFPVNKDLHFGSDVNVSNKILLRMDAPPREEIQIEWEEAARGRINAYFESARKQIRNRIQLREDLVQQQLESLLEFYVVWVPYEQSRHEECRQQVERLLAARKAARNFAAFIGEARLAKSSLDGFRENVLLHDTRKKNVKLYELKDREQLDAVAVLKRFAKPTGQRAPDFESTLDVAGKPYEIRVRNKREWQEFREFLRRDLEEKDPSVAFLYEHESRQIFDEDQSIQQELKDRRTAIHKKYGAPNPPYYAVLVGDGDSMGDVISKLVSVVELQAFSRCLSAFASTAEKVIRDLDGCPIYCGGDDVLALLPLHNLLATIAAVREAFAHQMASYAGATFSIGIAIAHALDPLSETLGVARSAEQIAKRERGKNALAITVIPRSGSPRTISGTAQPLLDRLGAIEAELQKETFGFSIGHDLKQFALTYPASPAIQVILPDLLARHLLKKKNGEELNRFLQAQLRSEPDVHQGISKIAEALLVLRPIHRAQCEARP